MSIMIDELDRFFQVTKPNTIFPISQFLTGKGYKNYSKLDNFILKAVAKEYQVPANLDP